MKGKQEYSHIESDPAAEYFRKVDINVLNAVALSKVANRCIQCKKN